MDISISISKKIERLCLPDSRLVKEDQLIKWKWKLGPVECLPLSLRNGILHSSSGDPQVEDWANSQGDVHGESYSQLEIFSTTYWTVVKHTIVKLGKRTPSRSGNRIGIGRQVCNNMLRPDLFQEIFDLNDVPWYFTDLLTSSGQQPQQLWFPENQNLVDHFKATVFHLIDTERQKEADTNCKFKRSWGPGKKPS